MAVNIPANSRIVTRGRVIIGPHSFGLTAVGGNIVQDVSLNGITYRVHTFTSSGILTVTTGPSGAGTIEYLLVGGGGGGGVLAPSNYSGGGGAGGFITGSYVITRSDDYKIDIGSGGSVGTVGNNTRLYTPLMGPSEFLLNAYGGGNGSALTASSGGSGGGGGYQFGFPQVGYGQGSSLFSQGNPGGSGVPLGPGPAGAAGGGGGAGSPGGTNSDGGGARETFIRGVPEWYAAGGGGSSFTSTRGNGGIGGSGVLGGKSSSFNSPVPINGLTNTGSGGGGAGGQGSSGIAIIRYRLS